MYLDWSTLNSVTLSRPNYTPTASTSSTSGTIRFSKFSIPYFSVNVELGQPEHDPCNSTLTFPSENESKVIAPPSISTAGRMYSSNIPLIFTSRSVSDAST